MVCVCFFFISNNLRRKIHPTNPIVHKKWRYDAKKKARTLGFGYFLASYCSRGQMA